MSDERIRMTRNSRHPCSIRGCHRKRAYLSPYCVLHCKNNRLHGHPLGRHITKKEYRPYVKVVRDFLQRHQHHAAVHAASEVMASLLTPPREEPQGKPLRLNPHWHLWRELWRLKHEGVTPEESLEVALAVWLLSYHFPHTLPDDKRLDYALASAIFRLRELAASKLWVHSKHKLVTQSRRPGSLPNGLLGTRIRTALAPFFVNMVKALQAEQEARAKKAAEIRANFPASPLGEGPTS